MSAIESRVQAFLVRCGRVEERLGIRRSTLSTKLFNDGRRLDQIASGKDVGILRLAKAERDLGELEGQQPRSRTRSERAA